RRHIESGLARAREANEIQSGRTIAGRLAELERIEKRLLARAEDAGDVRAATAAVRELSRLLEIEARVESQGAKVTVNVAQFDIRSLSVEDRSELFNKLLESETWVHQVLAENEGALDASDETRADKEAGSALNRDDEDG